MLGREAKAWRVDHVFGGEEGMDVTCDEAVTRAPVRSWTESDCDCDYDDTDLGFSFSFLYYYSPASRWRTSGEDLPLDLQAAGCSGGDFGLDPRASSVFG